MHTYTRIGLFLFIIFALLHFFARDIAWPSLATWGTEVEATSFYSQQKSIEKIAEVLMFFCAGLSLIGLWETRTETISEKKLSCLPAQLSPEEKAAFKTWLNSDLSYKYFDTKTQLKKFRYSQRLKGAEKSECRDGHEPLSITSKYPKPL